MPTEATLDAAGRLNLSYLFVATYADGTVYEQGGSDESLFGGVNAFTDIKYKPFKPLEELVRFQLMGNGHTFGVNLQTGEFDVDGVTFQCSPWQQPLPKGGKYELVYWRGHEHTVVIGEGRSIHYVHYRIGWIYRVGDLEWVQTIAVE